MIESILSFLVGERYDVFFGTDPNTMKLIGRVRAMSSIDACDKAQLLTVNYFWRVGMFVEGKPVHGIYEARKVKNT